MIGVAFIQAIIVGLALLVAGVPLAGVLAVIVLVLGIAQVPALIVTLPAIGYIWSSGDYGTAAAIAYTVVLFVSGMADNVLKPLMLGGVDAPMPVILLGALGGMATAGILGMFVGATLLALGYQIFMGWVAATRMPDRRRRKATRGRRAECWLPVVFLRSTRRRRDGGRPPAGRRSLGGHAPARPAPVPGRWRGGGGRVLGGAGRAPRWVG